MKLHEFTPYRLSVLTNRISSLIARAYTDRFGISIPQWRVIAVLGEESGITATEVAQRTAMDKVAVSRAVQGLVKAGRVRRLASQQDGRVAKLRLTAKGQRIYNEITPLALGYEDAVLEPLTRVERGYLDAILRKLSQRLDSLEAAR
ncbi:MAG: MarR family transcriptional regulator [Gammaproteobacteria bacterium]|nr:MAG: MarR family transcriptional regulator [Gammaproteobacteria bacterium]